MAFQIPKIEWLNVTLLGDTHTTTTIDGIASTAALQAGMRVKGSGVQAGTTIITVFVNSVLLSLPTTSTLVGTSLDFAFIVEFDYQPMEKAGKKLDPKERVAVSINGTRQVSIDYIEEIREMEHGFLTQTIFNTLEIFYKNHALFGRTFRYYEDKLSVSYIDYELSSFKFEPEKVAPKGPLDFVWNVKMKLRRKT